MIASFSGLLATVVSIGRTRLELLTVELREEVQRVAELLVWGAVALLAAGGGVLFAGLAIIFAFWDTHRLLAAVLVVVGYFVIAAGAALLVRSRLRSRRPFLAATLGELVRDEDELRGRAL
ncbi:MAG: phage holin family protein [Gammaproteobacteria bacterium]